MTQYKLKHCFIGNAETFHRPLRAKSVAVVGVSEVCVSPSHLQDKTIANLKKKNMELEKLKFICDVQVNELKRQIEPQQDDLKEKRERVRQVC